LAFQIFIFDFEQNYQKIRPNAREPYKISGFDNFKNFFNLYLKQKQKSSF